jgi:4-amino-4-deoxy-L-arabinose transferase-like glycosyltransferase
MRKPHPFWIFLVICSLAGAGLVLVATSLYGAGVSADAAKNLSTAESLLAGRGFFDHAGEPLVYWPPLFPLLLAGLSLLGGWDVFLVGWYLNVFLMAVNVTLAGTLIYLAFRDRPLYAYLGVSFVLTNESALRIHANVSSDPLYITFSLVMLLAAGRYLARKSTGSLWVMAACAALAMLQRWLGASLLAMAGLVVLIARWKDRRRLLRDGLILSLALLPVGAWIVRHNLMRYGTFWGNDSPPLDPWMNFEFSLTKMMHWVLPYHPRLEFLLLNPALALGILAVLLVLLAPRPAWRELWESLRRPETLATAAFLPLSLVGMAFFVVTGDHLDPYSDRYYVGFLAPVIILSFLLFDTLVLPRLRWPPARGRAVLAGVFGLWLLVYPCFSLVKYLRDSLANGEASNYNYYNNRAFRENPAIPEALALLETDPGATLYSNYADGAWFYTRRTAPLMPRSSIGMDVEVIREQYRGWPGDKPGYILWFLPNEFKHVVPPELLAEFVDVQLLYKGAQGRIYSVQGMP